MIRNFSQRGAAKAGRARLCRSADAGIDGRHRFLIRKGETADAAVVIGGGIGPLMLKMYNPDEQIALGGPSVAAVLRVGMLVLS